MLPVLVFFGTLAAAWYLLITRPQREQQGRHASLVGTLTAGQHVMTIGGLFGTIVAIEGQTVVLQLAQGVTTRVAIDGVARVASAQEAQLPAAAAQVAAQHQHADPRQAPALAVFHDPRPAPVAHVQPQVFDPAVHVPTNVTMAPPAPQPLGYAAPTMHSDVTLRAAAPTGAVPAQPGQSYQFSLGSLMPVQPPQPRAAVAHPHVQTIPMEPNSVQDRRHSQAPQGMGQSIRPDDPELQRIFERARHERTELAVEYQRLTSPLVSVDTPAPSVAHGVGTPVSAPPVSQTAGQLFVNGQGATTQPASVFPAPMRPPSVDSVVPRPSISVPELDAETSAAFQRRSPYSPASLASNAR